MISKKIVLQYFSKLNLTFLSVVFFVAFVVVFIFLKVYIILPSENTISYNNNNQNVLGLNIPSNLEFCGEKIPSNSIAIKEDLEKEFFNNNLKCNSTKVF